MITCQDADVLSAALSVGALDAGENAGLQHHLNECQPCRRTAGEYMAAAARLPLALPPRQPSPELRGRLMRAVYAEAQPARRPSRASRGILLRRLWAAVPVNRGFTLAAALATAAVIALTTWSGLHQTGTHSLSVGLASTPTAPTAHGTLVYVPGTNQGVVTVTGLPSPSSISPTGAVYEVWLLRPNGAAVPAAFLTQEPDGSWSAPLRADMGQFSTVAATCEPSGGSIAPTGPKVVLGYINQA